MFIYISKCRSKLFINDSFYFLHIIRGIYPADSSMKNLKDSEVGFLFLLPIGNIMFVHLIFLVWKKKRLLIFNNLVAIVFVRLKGLKNPHNTVQMSVFYW